MSLYIIDFSYKFFNENNYYIFNEENKNHSQVFTWMVPSPILDGVR